LAASAPGALPAGWSSSDLGNPDTTGSASATNLAITVSAGGGDIWGTSDEGHFAYRQVSGDFDVTCRMNGFDGGTEGWRKGGIMARATLAANAAHAYVLVAPNTSTRLQYRSTAGGSSASDPLGGGSPPIYFRLTRQGNTFHGYTSTDGVNWSQHGTRTIAMADPIYLGFAVTSHNDSQSTSVTFDKVTGFERTYDASEWGQRIAIAFPGHAGGGSLAGFPVLVKLGFHITGFSYSQFVSPDGDDLCFVDPDGTLLNHEIEKWDPAGTSCVWVQVPELDDTGSDFIHACWGNHLAFRPNSQADGSVWSNGFVAVYHLGESAGDTAPDSTANQFDGQLDAGMSDGDWVDAVVGNGLDFDGSADVVDIGKTASELGIGGGDPKHVSCWAYTRAFNGAGLFQCGQMANYEDWSLRTMGSDNAWRAQHWGADYDFTYPSKNRWAYFAHTYDGTAARTYVDGDGLAGSRTLSLNTSDDITFRLGRWRWAWLNAIMDELRVSTVVRDPAWIEAEWLNMISNEVFNSYGAVAGVDPVQPVVGNGSGATPGVGAATLNGDLQAGNFAEVKVYYGSADGGTDPGAWDGHRVVGFRSNGPFSANVDGLFYGQRYYYRCYATNAVGHDWADTTATFMTAKPTFANVGLIAKAFDNIQGDGYIIPISVLQGETPDGEYLFTGTISYGNYGEMAADYPALTDGNVLSLMWEGVFTAEAATYTFGTTSDDGSVLYLDLDGDGEFGAANEMIVDNRGLHGMRERTGEVTLDAGEYPIAIGFYENGGGEGIRVKWKKGSGLAFGALDFMDCGSGDFATDFRIPAFSVRNDGLSMLTTTSATCRAVVDATGAVFDVYVHWGETDGGTNAASWDGSAYAGTCTNVVGYTVGQTVDGLSPNTSYTFRFSLSNTLEQVWATSSTVFRTVGPPSVINGDATDITTSSATIHGELVQGGSADITVYWGLTDGGRDPGGWDEAGGMGTVLNGPFSSNVAVGASAIYYYRCYATNALGEDWADTSGVFTSALATVSIADAALVEGDSGTSNVVVDVTLSEAGASTVQVRYATADGTAVAGLDYVARSGIITFSPGQTQTQITFAVVGDEANETPSEDFRVVLSDPVRCTIDDGVAAVTILDDDITMDAWLYSTEITFGGYTGTETLANFPVFVSVGAAIGGFAYDQCASASGDDLRFLSGDGLRVLNHEIESWDTNGESVVWVQLPELSGTDTTIHMHWGHAAGVDALPSTTNGAVWANGYEAVWHFADDGGSLAIDATRNGYDGTRLGDVSDGASGAIGPAFNFGGSSGYVDLPDGFAAFPNGITVCAWAKETSFANWARIVDFGNGADVDNILLARRGTSDDIRWDFRDTVGGTELMDVDGNPLIRQGQWNYWAATCSSGPANGARMRFYLDGTERGTESGKSVPAAVTRTRNYIGESNWGSDAFFHGIMDEVSVSSVERSADWIHASWLSQVSNGVFCSYAPAERRVHVVNRRPTVVSASEAVLAGQVVSAGGGAAPAVYICWGTSDAGTVSTGAWDQVVEVGIVAEGAAFSNAVSGLASDSLYLYRCYATNAAGGGWSQTAEPFITGAVTLEATDATASESGSDAGTFTVTRPSSLTNVALEVHYAVDGLAVNGVDYQRLGGTVLVPAGAASATISVIPIDDIVGSESNETVDATLLPGGYLVGTPGSGSVAIEDDDVSPVEFPDLALWLDAGVGALNAGGSPAADGEAAAEWLDQTVHRHVATQAVVALRPLMRDGGLNAKSCLHFSGGDALEVPHDVLFDAGIGQTVFAVFLSTSDDILVSKGPDPGQSVGSWAVTPATYGVSGAAPDGLYPPRDREVRLVTGRYTGSRTEVFHNGEWRGERLVSGVAVNTNGLVVSSADEASVAEVILFNRALDDVERAQVEHYLLGKYFGPIVFSDPVAPATPTILDAVNVAINARALLAADIVSATLWYREGTSGPFSSIAMTNLTGNTYETVTSIPAGGAGTVQYYVSVTYAGDISGTSTWPFGGSGDPAELVRREADPRQSGPSARGTGLTITEVMYHPPSPYGREMEYVEIGNSETVPRDLSRYRLSGEIDFTFADGTVLGGRERIVVAKDPAFMRSFYGIGNVVGPFSGRLSDGGGVVRLRNQMDAVLGEVEYDDRYPWPAAADGAGHSLVMMCPDYGEGNVKAWRVSAFMHGSPGVSDPRVADGMEGLVINEVLAHTDEPESDYVELLNTGESPIDLTGCRLVDQTGTNEYVITNGVLAAGAHVAYAAPDTGFYLDMRGDAVYLVSPGADRLVDAVRFGAQENGKPWGRSPDGGGEWRVLASATQGGANGLPASNPVVINEIMYHPLGNSNDYEYVELHNRGGTAVNVGFWQFTDGISFTFPSNTWIPAGGYLVVAEEPALLIAAHPGVLNTNNTLGGFGGTLSDRGERLVLSKPDDPALPHQDLVIVDAVTYADGERWGKWADGGGSSLELIDPASDNMRGMNWTSSDETRKTTNMWTLIEHTGILDHGRNAADELQLFLEGPGECLIDDAEVFRVGEGNRVPNSTFDTGLSGWIIQGTHVDSTLETTEGYESSQSLHLRAARRGDNSVNRAEIDLSSALSNGDTATIRARARWMCGHPGVLLRLHGNWLEAYGQLRVPRNLGTPGARNSGYAANRGPAIYDVTHTPVLPTAGETVLVTAKAHDPDGLASVSLKYRNDTDAPATVLTVAMNDSGTGGDARAGDGVYSAEMPGHANNRTVAFHVEATDAHGTPAVNRFPEDAPTRECLVMFGQTPYDGAFVTYRIWITEANRSWWATRQKFSDYPVDATFVYGDFRPIYNGGARTRGSPFIRGSGNPETLNTSYVLYVPKDDRLLGSTSFNMDRLESDDTYQRERMSNWIADRIDTPFFWQRYVHLYLNEHHKGRIYTDSQQPNDDFAGAWWPNGQGGDLFKIDDWFEFNDASQVSREFNQNGQLLLYTTTATNGATVKKKARYRWSWRKENMSGLDDDYGNFYDLVDAANLNHTSPDYAALMPSLVDYEEWMHVFAVEHIIRNWDSYGYNRGKNMSTYKPRGDTWKMIMWDLDHDHLNGNAYDNNLFSVNCPTMRNKFYVHPPFRRAYWRALQEAVDGPMRADVCGPVMDANYAAFVADGVNVASPDNALKKWIADRRAFLLGQFNSVAADFDITTNGGIDFSTDQPTVTIAGTAPVRAKTILVNSNVYDVTFTSVTAWEVEVALLPGENRLVFDGVDRWGDLEGTDTITVTYTGEAPLPLGLLVINEIMYNPTNWGAEFVEVYNRSDAHAFDLGGWRINGADFTFPAGTLIRPEQYLVAAENQAVYAASYGNPQVLAGTFSGSLDNGGERLELRMPNGSNGWIVVDEVRYEDEPAWPAGADGLGWSLQLMDPARDNDHVANWATGGAVLCTPGAQNSVRHDLPDFPEYRINELQPVNVDTLADNAGDYDPWVELFNAGTNAVLTNLNNCYLTDVRTNLTKWAFPDDVSLLNGEYRLVWCDGETGEQAGTNLHAGFSLSATGGCVALVWEYAGIPLVLDYMNYGPVAPGLSLGLYPDGDIDAPKMVFHTPTPGSSNRNTSVVPVTINEWMADNESTIRDPADFAYEDWIELHNAGASPVDLVGFTLTDDMSEPGKWAIPAGTSIAAGGFLFIWTDDDAEQTSSNSLHAAFRLSAGGEQVALYTPEGVLVDAVTFGAQTPDVSEGRFQDGAAHIYTMMIPSPDAPNILSVLAVESEYGTCTPPRGTNILDYGTNVVCSVSGSPFEPAAGVRIECMGWQGSGDVTASGSGTSTVVTVTQLSRITWQWQTRYWLDTGAVGGGSVDRSDQWLAAGTSVTITATAAARHHLAGWSGDTNGCTVNGDELIVPMTQARRLTAMFEEDRYVLEIASAHGVADPDVGFYTNGWGVVLTNAVSSPDTAGMTQYVCTGWALTGNGPLSGTDTNMVMTHTNDAALTWLWDTNYWLTVASSNGGVDRSDQWLAAGTSVTITATADAHYHFAGWRGDTNGCTVNGDELIVPMTQARRLTAMFEEDRYVLEIASAYGVADLDVGFYTNGWGVVLTNAVSSPDTADTTQYVCTGWALTGNEPLSGADTNMVMTHTNDAVLTWLWNTNYWLATAASNGDVDVADGWFEAGSNVVATALPDLYYSFDAWSGDTAGCVVQSNRITVPMNGPRRISAAFTPALAPLGTPELWLVQHGLTGDVFAVEEVLDTDGDGSSAWQEFIADTDPTNARSVLRITDLELPGPGPLHLRWQGGVQAWQYVESRRTLGTGGPWKVLFTNVPPTDTNGVFGVVGPNVSPRFYRIRAVRP